MKGSLTINRSLVWAIYTEEVAYLFGYISFWNQQECSQRSGVLYALTSRFDINVIDRYFPKCQLIAACKAKLARCKLRRLLTTYSLLRKASSMEHAYNIEVGDVNSTLQGCG